LQEYAETENLPPRISLTSVAVLTDIGGGDRDETARYNLRMTEALESAADVAAFDVAMAEDGENIPWDQAKAELGWT
jgi:phosphoglucomutase